MRQPACFPLLPIFVLLSCMGTTVRAQTAPPDQHLAHFRQSLQDHQKTVESWNQEVTLQKWLTFLAIFLGGSVTALQAFKKDWVRPTTTTLGVVMTVLTSVLTLTPTGSKGLFTADYRTLQRATIAGQARLTRLSIVLDDYSSEQKAQNRLTIEEKFLKGLDQFDEMETKLLEGSPPPTTSETPTSPQSAPGSAFITSVHAQSGSEAPAWVNWANNPPHSDSHTLYFVGRSDSSSLSVAQGASYNAAVNAAVTYLISRKGADPGLLETFIRQSSTIDSDWFAYDKQASTYHFHTLLRLSKEIQDLTFPGSTAPLLDLRSVRVEYEGGPRSTTWRFEISVNGDVVARIPAHQFAQGGVVAINTRDGLSWPPVSLLESRSFDIHILGLRPGVGGTAKLPSVVDFAEGSARVDWTGNTATKEVQVKVVSTKLKLGSFVFNFRIERR